MLEELKEKVFKANLDLVKQGLVSHGVTYPASTARTVWLSSSPQVLTMT